MTGRRLLDDVLARYTFLDQTKAWKFKDVKLSNIHDKVLQGEAKKAILNDEGIFRIRGWVCVPVQII